ncbi:MAG TPA: hypothetical protein VGX28_14670 [Frankiaceae bacterium]|nr:hypothetical protein [Frankiaceae bacterium]
MPMTPGTPGVIAATSAIAASGTGATRRFHGGIRTAAPTSASPSRTASITGSPSMASSPAAI